MVQGYLPAVPRQLGDLARVLVGAGGRREFGPRVLAGDAADDGERQGDEHGDDYDHRDGAEGQRGSGLRGTKERAGGGGRGQRVGLLHLRRLGLGAEAQQKARSRQK